jgi:solute carrier family 25 (mitochondrial citrate transporter), member 1
VRSHATKLQSPIGILVSTIREHGFSRLYTGGAAFCLSNAAKSGVRFLAFDSARKPMPRDALTGKTTIAGNIIAGLSAGVAESVLVLTPGENIKTRLIDDAARGSQRVYRSASHAMRRMLADEGPVSFFRGVLPVTMKQSSNAMVRFTSYNLLSSALGPYTGAMTSVAAGSLAGVITVYCTMPFDNVKTQMQSIAGREAYKGSWDCVRQLIHYGGIGVLWKGTLPRLIRLSVGLLPPLI